jgi:hypothetical protein
MKSARRRSKKVDLKTAKTRVRELGFTLTKRDDEYRLALLSDKDSESSAYYTDDLNDAVATAEIWSATNES